MIKSDLLKSKLKFASKLKDRQRIKGCNFSYLKKEENLMSSTLEEFKKKRIQKRLLREKEMNILKNNLNYIRRQLLSCFKKKEEEAQESFSDNLDYFMRRLNKKSIIRQAEYLANSKKDKTEIKDKSYSNAINDIINDIKNKSFNFYKVINDSNIKEEIKEKNNFKTFKFYKDFLSIFKNLKRSSSAKNIKSKIFSKLNNSTNNNNKTIVNNNQKNLYLYYSSLIPKKTYTKMNYYYQMNRTNKMNKVNIRNIYDKKFNSNINNQNIFAQKVNNITPKKIYTRTENNKTITPKKKYILDNSIKPSFNKTINNFKSKINLKRAFIGNKQMNSNNQKYFLKNIRKELIRPSENKTQRRVERLTTFSNLENDTKTSEDITIFRLKKRFVSSQIPNIKPKYPLEKQLFVNKLKTYLLK